MKVGDLVKYVGYVRPAMSSEKREHIIYGVLVSRAAGWADVVWNDGQRGMIRDCDIEVVSESG